MIPNPFNRWDLINNMIERHGYKKYLEIGVQTGDNFDNVNCDHKVGVDPDIMSAATIHQTSDNFFRENKEQYDIIFIDGLHHSEQVEKDINNALSVLNRKGTIICHDMLPETEEAQIVPRIQPIWNGDCWKAFVVFRATRRDLDMYTINADQGLGVIQKGSQHCIDIYDDQFDWKNFTANKHEWMNIITPEKFYEIMDKRYK